MVEIYTERLYDGAQAEGYVYVRDAMEWLKAGSGSGPPGLMEDGGSVESILGPTTHGAPSCEVCGRRDETLRAIVIPYLFSLIVVTMRRAWSGVYCWRHRIQRLIAASLISGVVGWWGLPWGFIHTPITLFKLARGGEVPEDVNVELLARVAIHKLNTGEPGEAMRIFQEALRIKEDERTRNSLLQLQDRYPLATELKENVVPIWYVISLLGASFLGISLGFIDFVLTTVFGWVLGADTYLVLALLSWAPFVALLTSGAIFLREGIRWVFERTQTDNLVIGTTFALGVSGLFWYGIPQGYLIGDYLGAILNGLSFDSVGDFILTSGAVVSQGGLWFLLDSIESGLIGDVVYLIFWILAGMLFIWTGFEAARDDVHWQVRLELLRGDLRREEPSSQLPAWGAIAGVGLVFLLGFAIFAGRGRLRGGPELVAYSEEGDSFYLAGEYERAEEAYRKAINSAPGQPGPHDSLGWVLYAMGRLDEAAVEFTTAMELDPAWADPHLGLAYIGISTGDVVDAESGFRAALDLAENPFETAQAYYGLGILAHQDDDLETAIAFYQQAVREDWQLSIAHMDMAIAYYSMASFDQAVEHATDIIGISPDWAAPHALLALAYFQLDQIDNMENSLEWAEDLGSVDIYSQLLLADVFWERHAYDLANVILQSAAISFPENTQVPLLLARLAALKGDFGEAEALIERQLSEEPNLVDGHIARARVAIEKQDLGEAETALNRALEIAPDSWEAHNWRSFVYFHQGRIEQARQAADITIQAYPFEASAYVHRAFALRALGEIEAASQDAQQAITLAPKDDLAYFIQGVLELDRGESERGAEYLRRFLTLAQDRAYVRDYIQQAQAFLDQMP